MSDIQKEVDALADKLATNHAKLYVGCYCGGLPFGFSDPGCPRHGSFFKGGEPMERLFYRVSSEQEP
jgi:hypothetical protein